MKTGKAKIKPRELSPLYGVAFSLIVAESDLKKGDVCGIATESFVCRNQEPLIHNKEEVFIDIRLVITVVIQPLAGSAVTFKGYLKAQVLMSTVDSKGKGLVKARVPPIKGQFERVESI